MIPIVRYRCKFLIIVSCIKTMSIRTYGVKFELSYGTNSIKADIK